MRKAILIMDMPTCCYECKFFNNNDDYTECIVTGKVKDNNFKKFEEKMNDCPLSFVPSKRYHLVYGKETIEMSDDKIWNDCIDSILRQ